MAKFGYKQSNTDYIIFIKYANKKVTVLVVYVDDMVVTSDDPHEVSNLKAQLQNFKLKI